MRVLWCVAATAAGPPTGSFVLLPPQELMIRYIACLGLLVAPALLHAQDKSAKPVKKVTFEDDVKPIFRQHCFNCHNQNEKKGGLAIDSYGALLEGGGSGEIVFDDGDAEGSRLWQLVNHDDTPIMPPNQDKMPAEQLAIIRAWLEGGILENSGSKAKAKKANTLTYVASVSGKPDGPAAMPESVSFRPAIVTDRAAAATAIATSPWAPLVAIAGQKQITLYHTDSNELLGILPFPEGVAQSLRFSRDGRYLVAGGGEHAVQGIVAVYDVKTGKRAATVGDELDIVFDADANRSLNRIALGGPQRMLRIYDAANGELMFDIKKHTDWIYTVAFSPDGVLIASGDRSGGLCVWEADTGRLYLDLAGHKGAVSKVAWRDDSNVLASASEDGSVKLWDIKEGKVIKSINAHGGGVTDVTFDHQGRVLTAGKDNRAKIWDAAGKEIKNFGPMPEAVLEAAVSHDGRRVVFGDWNGTFVNASADNPKEQFTLSPNPPAMKVRTEKLKERLVSLQSTIAPLKTKLDQSNNSLAATKKSTDELGKKSNKAAQDVIAAETQLAATRKQVAEIGAKIPKLTSLSRSLHDQVIASRVMLEKNPQLQEPVAEAEQKLAEHLTLLAAERRKRVAKEKSIVATTKVLARNRNVAEKLKTEFAAAQKILAEATTVAEKANSAFAKTQEELKKVQQELSQMNTVAK